MHPNCGCQQQQAHLHHALLGVLGLALLSVRLLTFLEWGLIFFKLQYLQPTCNNCVDHVLELGLNRVLPHGPHDRAQLRGGDGAVSFLVQQGKCFLELSNLLLGQLGPSAYHSLDDMCRFTFWKKCSVMYRMINYVSWFKLFGLAKAKL